MLSVCRSFEAQNPVDEKGLNGNKRYLEIVQMLVLYLFLQSNLSGFYDPCPEEEKMLRIRYLFRDAMHEVTYGDNEAVRIPKECKQCTLFAAKACQVLIFVLVFHCSANQKPFSTGRLRPEVQPVTLLYTILAEKVPLLYTFY